MTIRPYLVVALAAFAVTACGDMESEAEQSVSAMPPPAEQGTDRAPAETDTTGDAIAKAVAGDHRSEDNRKRDQYRHPQETLEFFGLEPDMRVLELWPGGGWYTEILAAALPEGELVAGQFDPEVPPNYRKGVVTRYEQKLASDPVYDNVELLILKDGPALNFGEDESFDMVVTFRNVHNWIPTGELDKYLSEAFRVLKPGGVLGVTDHRAPEGADAAESAKRGYVPVAYLVERAEAVGFRLDGQSEINANPKDTKDYPRGVWELPPTLAGGDDVRQARLAVGESDRMTLRFVKPATE